MQFILSGIQILLIYLFLFSRFTFRCRRFASSLLFEPKASQSNVRQSNARKSVQAASLKTRGAMIMKTVSILIVNSRRICNQRSKETTTQNGKSGKNRHRPNKMDDSIGKPTPKTLETLKRKTHFNK